jgi:hypothetical protein
VGSCDNGMARHRVADGGDGPHMWRVAANSGQPKKGGPPASGLGVGLTTHHPKKTVCYEMLHRASDLAGSCEHGNETLGSIKGGKFLD